MYLRLLPVSDGACIIPGTVLTYLSRQSHDRGLAAVETLIIGPCTGTERLLDGQAIPFQDEADHDMMRCDRFSRGNMKGLGQRSSSVVVIPVRTKDRKK